MKTKTTAGVSAPAMKELRVVDGKIRVRMAKTGEVYDVPRATAHEWLKQGICEAV